MGRLAVLRSRNLWAHCTGGERGKACSLSQGLSRARLLNYVARIEPKVVLIDGRQLADLMFDCNVGVTPLASDEIKRIDSDYFSEE